MSKRDPKATAGEAPAPPQAPSRDVVFVYGKDESSGDLGVIRRRDEHVELGRMRAMRDGEPIHGELVRLSQRAEHDRLFDVDVVHDGRAAGPRTGPAKVSTRTYRDNWDQIFGRATPRAGSKLDN